MYFIASDLVILPYLSVSGSGISQLAYGYDRPVIASKLGSLTEVVHDGENGRLVPPGDSKSLAQAVIESLVPENLSRLTLNASRTKERFSWDSFVRIVCND